MVFRGCCIVGLGSPWAASVFTWGASGSSGAGILNTVIGGSFLRTVNPGGGGGGGPIPIKQISFQITRICFEMCIFLTKWMYLECREREIDID